MYEYLVGRLIEKKPTSIVLDVHGVGYLAQIPVSTFSGLPEVGQNVKLLTHFSVREDTHLIYGFLSEEERGLFRLLISVSGIGPKTAMAVLSGIAILELKRALIAGNLVILTGIPGIGRKTAERLVVELREKIVLDESRDAFAASAGAGGASQEAEDSIRALVELGYRRPSAKEAVEKALKKMEGAKHSAPDLIRDALKYI